MAATTSFFPIFSSRATQEIRFVAFSGKILPLRLPQSVKQKMIFTLLGVFYLGNAVPFG